MSQELDSGALTLLILIGYWCWRLGRSFGNQLPADLKTADLTSADVYEPFGAAVAECEKQSERLEWKLLNVEAVKTVDAALDRRSALVTVRFSSKLITYRRHGAVDLVDEARKRVVDVADDWTFARKFFSSDPSWNLVATASA